MKKKLMIIVALIIIMIMCFFSLNYPIFIIENKDNDYVLSDNTYLLGYTYTTGTGWYIIDSYNHEMVNSEIVLNNLFDPRLLKDNNDFDLDYSANYIVFGYFEGYEKIDNVEIPVLHAKKVTVLCDTDKSKYTVFDMSVTGIIKSFLGMAFEKYRISK